jgi:hypothetical protein
MKFTEINSFKGNIIAKRYVKRTSMPIPPDTLSFLRKHIKKVGSNGTPVYLMLTQYDDQWYQYTFNDPAISNFKDFFQIKISPYFEIINKDNL